MSRRCVSLCFCGGCNPSIDRGQIVLAVKSFIEEFGYELVYNSSKADFFVYLSGCLSGCAHKYAYIQNPESCLFVSGESIDFHQVEAKALARVIRQRIKDWYEDR